MLLSGVLLGLGCAACQSICYIFSRRFVLRHPGGPLRLLVMAHVMMGAAAAAALPVFWPDSMPPLREYALPFAQMVVFFLAAQILMLAAMRKTEASRFSPLLGLKILFLAGWAWAFLQPPGPWQWAAVGMSVTAAVLLATAGGHIGLKAVALIALVCMGYSLSDLGIVSTIAHFTGRGTVAPIFVACLCYTVMGLLAAPLLIWQGTRDAGTWGDAVGFAVSWLVAMVLFFACLATVGVLLGNILQATRGIMSVALGALVARAGHQHLEQTITRGVFARRIAAATLMAAAIALYVLNQ